MWRYLAGGAGALLLAGGGLMLWQSVANVPQTIGAAPAAAQTSDAPASAPPAATEATREEKRFRRYDKDRNGAVSREEWLASRRKAYAKLDTNSDGKLSFDEWSIKTTDRFAKADGDKTGILNVAEFATTRIVRQEHKAPPCVAETD